MKITITEESKNYLSINEMSIAKQIIKDFKEDNGIIEYGKTAARIASGVNGSFEILKAEAEIGRNSRIFNQYSDNSGLLDIWFTFYAFDKFYGFYEIGAYLSDIWKCDGTPETNREIKDSMFINKFERNK